MPYVCVCVCSLCVCMNTSHSGSLHEVLIVVSVVSQHLLRQAGGGGAAVVWLGPLQHEPAMTKHRCFLA